ncbi:MAG: glycosyltransferase, partial [Candidatus Falkowbacteria bacterium]
MQNQSNKKTILYLVTQSELGGVQRYIFDLAENLKTEFNVSVAFGEQGEKGELAKKLKIAEITYYTIPHLKRAISPINDLKALFEIIKLIKKIKPNIIH